MIYVHGFLGSATETWSDIIYHVDILDHSPFDKSDLYFFDYPAERNIVAASVKRLQRFISTVYPDPTLLFAEPQALPLSPEVDFSSLRGAKPYSKLILVGHSLGAVIIRRFIADEAWGVSVPRSLETPSYMPTLNFSRRRYWF